MARALRTVGLSAAAAVLVAMPAAAQFNPFEALFGSPPRPPSNVPTGRPLPPSYPEQRPADPRYGDPRYPEQPYPAPGYPEQAAVPRAGTPAGAIQSQPLPPPTAGTAAVIPPGQP